jgi:hypothetical protein
MVISFLNMIPGSIATTLFAVASGDTVALRARVRFGLGVALGVGVPLSLGIAALARPVMGVFGHEYATAAADALSLLALTYVVQVFRQFFVAISRVRMRVRQASMTAVLIGLMEMGAAWAGGRHSGLMGLVVWLAGAFVVEGLLMAPTVLRVVLSKPRPADAVSTRPVRGRHRAGARNARTAATPAPTSAPGPVLPRQREVSTMDETAVIPRINGAADTAVIPRVVVDGPMP